MFMTERQIKVFKVASFAKAADKAKIKDAELCGDIQDILNGLGTDLGGNVFKERLNKNMHRSIILRVGRYWVYVYLFAKKDRENIDDEELDAFRDQADVYAKLTEAQIEQRLKTGQLREICHETEVQE